MSDDATPRIHLKVAIVGSHPSRVCKVASILQQKQQEKESVKKEEEQEAETCSAVVDDRKNDCFSSGTNGDTSKESGTDSIGNVNAHMSVEYLPCVATFESYEDESSTVVRYLAKMEYHKPIGDGSRYDRGQTLAPFFDSELHSDESSDNNNHDGSSGSKEIITKSSTKSSSALEKKQGGVVLEVPGIGAIAIGCGIENEQDVVMIQNFLNTLSTTKSIHNLSVETDHSSTAAPVLGSNRYDYIQADQKLHKQIKDHSIMIMDCIQPNSQYKSMDEENKAYRQLSALEKEQATQMQTMGPGKMAKFVNRLALHIVKALVDPLSSLAPSNSTSKDGSTAKTDTSAIDSSPPTTSDTTITSPSPNNENDNNTNMKSISKNYQYQNDDPTVIKYACKRCRTILFDERDLQDPPHTKAQRAFLRRNTNSSSTDNSAKCQSLFLQGEMDWMTDDEHNPTGIGNSFEGKLFCPKFNCKVKLGLWNWGGVQSSCGTWVTPAIQIPLSRVDLILPQDSSLSALSPSVSTLPTMMPTSTTTMTSSSITTPHNIVGSVGEGGKVDDDIISPLAGLYVAKG